MEKKTKQVFLWKKKITLTKKTCKKSPYYMRKSACKGRIVKKAKIFSSYVKHF